MSKLNNIIIALIGKSGCGKTTIADKLNREYDYNVLKSYTTRPPRNPDDTDHTYISEDEFDKLTDIVAFTNFNGYRYCATKDQVDAADIYVIDPYGLEQLKKNYSGQKKIVSIYVDVPMDICLDRMRTRGDSEDKCWERLRHDDETFRGIKGHVDYEVNGVPSFVWLEINKLIKKEHYQIKNLYGKVV